MRHLQLALLVLSVMIAGAGPGMAQRPVIQYYTAPAPRTVYVVPQQRATVVMPPRYQARSYVATSPRIYRSYAPVRPAQPLLPFRRYQRAIITGQDPNWATGRGVRLYKPWEY